MKILIVDEMHLSLLQMLEEKGWIYDYLPEIQRAGILEKIADYQGLIIRSKTPLDTELLTLATQLRFIGRAGAGLEQIDLQIVEKKKIRLFAAPEGNRDAVGEHTLALLLTLLNKIHITDREVRQKIWHREANRGTELGGKTVGIIGYGNMGKAFAKRLQGFDCQVLAYDKYLQNYTDTFAKEAAMEAVFEQADILSLHIPLTGETRHLVNDNYLDRFRKKIFLLNTARGEIVNLKDLLENLQSGKVAGAGLDVLENEKLSTLTPSQNAVFEQLAGLDNVLFTPHIAGWSRESYVRINEVLVAKIENWLKNTHSERLEGSKPSKR
jgi:D-3-phosphoglycerate dehydrogenase / 2-oxoglutarate reductase